MLLKPCPKPTRKRKASSKGLRKTRMKACRKRPRRINGKRNPALVGWVHGLDCDYCTRNGWTQTWRTEASHMPFSRRFGDENNVIPLCAWCHREAPYSWHRNKRLWLEEGGREQIAALAKQYTEKFYRETGLRSFCGGGEDNP